MAGETFERKAVARWMRLHAEDHTDECGDVNMTALAEAAAEHFGVKDPGGPLDDPDHWIWEEANYVFGQVAEGAL